MKRELFKRAGLVALLLAFVAAYFAFDLNQHLTLENLQKQQEAFQQWRAEAPWQVTGGFFLLYVLVTALSLPGAAVMTLAAGALFGLLTGLVLVSFASTIGATLAFLVSRYLLHDSVKRRFGDRLAPIYRGIERDGVFYLFTLRLVPLFPFFLINLLMGLTPIRTVTYYWITQVGMLPGTVVYINAGTQLARIESVGDVFSPALLASFALLGLFPLLAKFIVGALRKRRVYAGWHKPTHFDRNLIVIGAGAGGLVCAYIAAAVKARVTLIEAGRMGGDCLNTGCVPSKTLIRSAKLAHQIRHAERYGLEAQSPRFSFAAVMARVRDKIRTIEPHDSAERYRALGAEVLEGYARLTDPWTVEIKRHDGTPQRLSARAIILATGAEPVVPALPGLDSVDYVTSDTLWDKLAGYNKPPARLLVLGGGPIGCELAQAFARLGVDVTQVQQAERLLPREDEDVSTWARRALEQDGVRVLTAHRAVRCEKDDNGQHLVLETGTDEVRAGFDLLLLAVGRTARTQGFGLETLDIAADRVIQTNAYLQTRYPNIYAVGDAAGPYQFTHTAAHTAWFATVNALFGQLRRFRVDYRVIPHTTFIDPEIAQVGLNERQAREQDIRYEVSRYALEELDRAITDSADHGFVKVLTVPGKDKILGVTIVGEQAGELLAEYVLAMKHGLGLNKILGTIHVYPTMAEANKFAAGQWKQAHAPQRVLKWLARYHAWRCGTPVADAHKT